MAAVHERQELFLRFRIDLRLGHAIAQVLHPRDRTARIGGHHLLGFLLLVVDLPEHLLPQDVLLRANFFQRTGRSAVARREAVRWR